MLNNRIDLARYFKKLGFKYGAEIGVADGRYSEILCQEIPNLELICVDPWRTYPLNSRGGRQEQHSRNYEKAKKRLEKYNVNIFKNTSMDVVKQIAINSLDFVFIDGNHDFDFVMQDIIEWSKKVRSGGIVSGHDYYHFRNSGVIEAVNAYTQAHKLELNIIPKNNSQEKDDRHPCFWWIKP
jgi:hypothetical protein